MTSNHGTPQPPTAIPDHASAVAVIGGGIAGLTLALALRREGVECTVFERSPRPAEVGAGLQLAPNATRLLHRLGVAEALRAIAVLPRALRIRGWDDDRPLATTALGAACLRGYNAPYYTVHRAQLHRVLREALGAGPLRTGHRLTALTENPDGVHLAFASGARHRADVVIGADGVHSVVRARLAGDAPVFSGSSVYRGLVPADRLPWAAGDPEIRVWPGPGRHLVCYPVSAGREVSFTATVPAGAAGEESWTAEGDPAELTAAYRGWNPTVTRLIAAADTVRRWPLHDRESLPGWVTPRVALLGDAAHPMLPFLAQGASQAIEDAVTLAVCLGRTAEADAPTALRRYQELRLPRTRLIQRGAREATRFLHHRGSPGPGRLHRTGAAADPHGLAGLRAMGWLYGHDAEAVAAGAIGEPSTAQAAS
ncbi:FAD-dependent oxidoreductase [Streptomyces sp. MUSC 125]|uniref:FAD-dependent oxidoreductase n=1 Tax=Streptomyces sp. MUSC 125 TaxID=1428624 RepID=UPI000A55FA3B|nr:FAD-dependent oxidoreductase [Streptomyces sp. MUSC 125]